jgi:hypothetical protein
MAKDTSKKSNKELLDEYQWASFFEKLELDASPLITILCEVGREPLTQNNVSIDTVNGLGRVFGLRMIGASERTYGCLENDKSLRKAFTELLGNVQFRDSSLYERNITAGNALFDNDDYLSC